MKRILKNINNKKENIIKIDLNELEKIINPNIIEVHDCVIPDLENRIVKKIQTLILYLKDLEIGQDMKHHEMKLG